MLEASAVEPSPGSVGSPVAEQPALEAPGAPSFQPSSRRLSRANRGHRSGDSRCVCRTNRTCSTERRRFRLIGAVEVAAIVQIPAVIHDAPAAEVLPDAAPRLDLALARTMAEAAAPVEELPELLEPPASRSSRWPPMPAKLLKTSSCSKRRRNRTGHARRARSVANWPVSPPATTATAEARG